MTTADVSTETPTAPDPAEDVHRQAAPDGQTTEESDPSEDQRTEDTPSREAAKWRRKLRDTEQERDDLAARLDTMQRREVARLATTPGRDEDGHPVPTLYDAADVFGDDADLADLIDDDGHLDEQRIRATIRAATENRAHVRADLAARPPRAPASQGRASHGDGARRSAGEGWQSLLRGGR